MSVKAIVCVDNNWGIGYDGLLLVQIPEDMKFFKEKTMGNAVVMGKNTYNSIGHPLKGRENFVVTSSSKKKTEDNIMFCSIDFMDGYITGSLTSNNNKDVYIIGGESIYNRYIDIYDEIFVTQIDCVAKADKFFPKLEESERYKKAEVLKDDYSLINTSGNSNYFIHYTISRWIPK